MFPSPRILQYGNIVIPKINGVYTDISPTVTGVTMSIYSQSVCSTDRSTAYIFGGFNNGTSTNAFYKYNASTNTYTILNNSTISARFGSGMTYYDGKIYIFGGTSSSGNVSEFYSYDINGMSFNTITSTNTPSGRSHLRMCTVGSMLYMFGGENSNNLFSFDPSTNAWTSLANCPITNNINGDMCTDGKYLYVIGNSYNFYRYNIDTNTWDLLGNRPSSTAYRSCYINGYIYAYGSKVLQVYNIETNAWNVLPSGGYSVTRNGMLGLNDAVYSFGGVGSSSNSSVWKIT